MAKEAYTEAVNYFQAEFRGKKADELTWITSSTSIKDVQSSILRAHERYKDASRFKPLREKLRKASEIMLYYGAALDILAQHHPEYVSLAWGTMKFIFIVRTIPPFAMITSNTTQGIINHAELVAEFARAITEVGEVLPRAKLNSRLYQTEIMKDAVVGLYRHILLFLKKAMKWYQLSTTGRAISAIMKPFKTDLKSTIDEVTKCATIMEAVARDSMKAELRDTHSLVQVVNNRINDMEIRFTDSLATMRADMDQKLQVLLGGR